MATESPSASDPRTFDCKPFSTPSRRSCWRGLRLRLSTCAGPQQSPGIQVRQRQRQRLIGRIVNSRVTERSRRVPNSARCPCQSSTASFPREGPELVHSLFYFLRRGVLPPAGTAKCEILVLSASQASAEEATTHRLSDILAFVKEALLEDGLRTGVPQGTTEHSTLRMPYLTFGFDGVPGSDLLILSCPQRHDACAGKSANVVHKACGGQLRINLLGDICCSNCSQCDDALNWYWTCQRNGSCRVSGMPFSTFLSNPNSQPVDKRQCTMSSIMLLLACFNKWSSDVDVGTRIIQRLSSEFSGRSRPTTPVHHLWRAVNQ